MIIDLMFGASFIVKLIMLFLIIASIYSVFIIVNSYFGLKSINKEIEALEIINRNEKDNFYGVLVSFSRRFKGTFLSSVFIEAIDVIESSDIRNKKNNTIKKVEGVIFLINKKIDRAYQLEKDMYQSQYKILATIASSSPYIGLVGTVIGIMNSFIAIADMKSVGLEYLAPSIAEALIVTAMGLFVAIPANIFFNKLNFIMEGIDVYINNIKEKIIIDIKERDLDLK